MASRREKRAGGFISHLNHVNVLIQVIITLCVNSDTPCSCDIILYMASGR